MAALKLALGLVLSGFAWTIVASLAFLTGTGLLRQFPHPFYQWWTYFFLARTYPNVAAWLAISGGFATALLAVFGTALALRGRRLGPSIQPRLLGGKRAPIRGRTDNLGHADWLRSPRRGRCSRDIDLPRSTLADIVGQMARLVRPLVDAVARHVIPPLPLQTAFAEQVKRLEATARALDAATVKAASMAASL